MKKSKPVGCTRTMYSQTGEKIQSELKRLSGVISDFLSCTLGSFDKAISLCLGFCRERSVAGLGPSGLWLFVSNF